MAEGGFYPNYPNSFEMNDVTPDDDDQPLLNPSRDITENSTSFTIPESSQESEWIESNRERFKGPYHIDDETFDVLKLNLRRGDDKIDGEDPKMIYYRDALIISKRSVNLLSLDSIKGTGAAEFRSIVKENQ